jgi:hypothetical protein
VSHDTKSASWGGFSFPRTRSFKRGARPMCLYNQALQELRHSLNRAPTWLEVSAAMVATAKGAGMIVETIVPAGPHSLNLRVRNPVGEEVLIQLNLQRGGV